jgi:hypothetical protein
MRAIWDASIVGSNDAARRQFALFRFAKAQLSEDIFGVLSQDRRRAIKSQRRFGKSQGAHDLRHGSGERMRQVAPHFAMADLRIIKYIGNVIDRCAWHTRGIEFLG